jgi:dTDP-4-dehydrorhamnose 3,5-epimerase
MPHKPPPKAESFQSGDIKGVVIQNLRQSTDPRGWLVELFRKDEIPPESFPAMAYISSTKPGVARGPHEHLAQSDFFCFVGPSNFKIRLWDNRPESETYLNIMTLMAGADDPKSVMVPAGVVHGYHNIGDVDGIVVNCPNRLYQGEGRREDVDEIRYENDPGSVFSMDN